MEPLTAFTEAAVNEQYCLRWGHAFLPCILRKEEMETWPRQFGDAVLDPQQTEGLKKEN